MQIKSNSFIGGEPLLHRQMASHLEHVAQVLRENELQHMTRDDQLRYVHFALSEHVRAITED